VDQHAALSNIYRLVGCRALSQVTRKRYTDDSRRERRGVKPKRAEESSRGTISGEEEEAAATESAEE